MRKIQLLIPCLLISLSSCQTPESSGDFTLLPQPKEFTISGSSKLMHHDIKHYISLDDSKLPITGKLLKTLQARENKSEAEISFRIDTGLNLASEGYELGIFKKKISIEAKDEAGLLYAFMTLEQLMEDAKEQDTYLPQCEISDAPSLSYRAIHLDLKHHLEKPEYYYEIMDRLAHYKVNAIIVEFEDKLKYERQPEVAAPGAMDINEWIKLSEYAMKRNIEISPLIQGLGHASFILKHEKYNDLRDDPKSDWAFNPLNEDTYKVQFDLYLDGIEATPNGKYLHVGGDEVHITGRNSGISPLKLQLEWLNKVCDFAEEHGRIPIFWDDMPLKYAGVIGPTRNTMLTKEEVDKVWKKGEPKLLDFLDQFPTNCIYMRWNYGAPQALGNARAMQWYTDNGLMVMGATAGQTRWNLMPQNKSNLENIRSFALSSIETGNDGLLLTLWDDASPHFELYWRGIIFFAEYTWTGDARSNEEVKSAYRQREYGIELANAEYAFIDRLEIPVGFWGRALMQKNSRNNLHRFKNPKEEVILTLPDPDHKGAWGKEHQGRLEIAENMILECDSISSLISAAKMKAIRNPYTLNMYSQVNKLVQFTPRALLMLKEYDEAENSKAELEALKAIRKLHNEFQVIREKLEEVYGIARILNKPDNYILDQDHHTHAANQSLNFDWQFYAEMLFLEKIEEQFN